MTVVPFFTLGTEILQSIGRMKLGKVGKRLAGAHKMDFIVEDAVYEAMANRCNQVDIGARQIDHLLDQGVLPELSRRILERMGDETMPARVTMGVSEAGEFTYTFAD
jgi:type VI secretion system protein VasG